jgi:hypothetical protein
MLLVPSTTVSVNLVVTSSQVEIPPMEKENVREQTYPLTKATQEGGILQNNVQEDEHRHEMVTF